MAKRKRSFRKKKFRRKRRKMNVRTLVRRELNKNIETKQTLGAVGPSDVSSTNVVFNLNDIVNGTEDHERIGDQIRARMMEIKYTIEGKNLATNIVRLYHARVIIVWMADPTQPIFVPPSVTTGLWDYTVNQNMYVMYDKVHTISPTVCVLGQTAVDYDSHGKHHPQIVKRHLKINLRNRKMKYDGPLGLPVKGRITMVVRGVAAPASTENATFQAQFRLYYKDA